MFIYDLSEKRDFFCSFCEVDFGFVDDMVYRKVSFKSSGKRNNTISTKLVATGRNREVS